MSDTTVSAGATLDRHKSWRRRARAMFLRSEALRGYALLSPTLFVMAFAMGIPFAIMVVMSFWTQVGFDIDTTLTLANYGEAIDGRVYRALLLRSVAISGTCTIVTVLLAYPMAYYVAFHVHQHKLFWIILMTLPFWTSYLLRVFAWKVTLGFNGVINSGLKALGLIDQPLEFQIGRASCRERV